MSALQEAVIGSERQLQHMNNITEEIFSIVATDENVPDCLKAQLGGKGVPFFGVFLNGMFDMIL